VDNEGNEHLCACISRSLNKHEKNYCSFKGELLACVWACQTLRHYLHGQQFTVVTDHQPLMWLVSNKDLVGQYARWAMIMSEFDLTIIHRKGSNHVNADVLSRMPRESDADATGARLDVEVKPSSSFVELGSASQLEPPAEAIVAVITACSSLLPLCHLSSWMAVQPLDVHVSVGMGVTASCMYASRDVASTLQESPASDAHVLQCAAAAAHSQQLLHYTQSVMPTSALWDIPDHASLLSGNTGSLAEGRGVAEPCANSVVGEQRISSLRARALGWLDAAACELSSCVVDQSKYQLWRPACVVTKRDKHFAAKHDQHGVLHTAGINTHVIADQFFPEAMAGGVVVLELFGGMCAGLEMLLRNGVKVLKYLYCDKNDTVRRVAAHRLHQLSAQYPALLSPESFYYAFTAFPAQDVWRISTTELIHAGVLNGDQWMIVAGWECQDLSPAGSGKGIFGDHSSTFFAMRHIIGAVQQLQPHKPPAYFIENTYMAFDFGKVVRTMPQNIDVICNSIGHPVACDAAQFDSYAHRMRHYWTNLAHTEHLQMLLKHVHRSPGLLVSDVLLPGRICLPVETADRKPFYKCNVKGAARSAFPTFVAFQSSRAFVANGPGAVYDGDTRRWTEPCPDEREVSMGYDRGCTKVAHLWVSHVLLRRSGMKLQAGPWIKTQCLA